MNLVLYMFFRINISLFKAIFTKSLGFTKCLQLCVQLKKIYAVLNLPASSLYKIVVSAVYRNSGALIAYKLF